MRSWCPPRRCRRPVATALAVSLLALCATHWAGTAWGAAGWSWPVEGKVITRYDFGGDPYAGGQHRGIDIAAPLGAPVAAATSGTVTFAGSAASSGLTVAVRTADRRFDTSYLHLDSLGVEEGERVERGTELGTVGTTGKPSAGHSHLHFGVRDAGDRHGYRDPLLFLEGEPPIAEPPAAPVPTSREPRALPRPARPLPGPAPVAAPKGIPVGAGAGARVAARRVNRAPVRVHALPARASDAVATGGQAARLDLAWTLACAGLAVAAGALARPIRSRRKRRAAGCGMSARAAASGRL